MENEVIERRLCNTGLSSPLFTRVDEAVSHLGAVQAQDFVMAKWGLSLRVNDATDRSVEQAFNRGDILRTHVMRPTWHFVVPEDIRWMLNLTSHRVKAFMTPSNRKIGLDEKILNKSNRTIVKALRDKTYLTRKELKSVLADEGIQTGVQTLAHILAWAELDGLVCSGPIKGKQATYAILEERVPEVKEISREEGLARLAKKYFNSHGPAQPGDFSWWSGLTLAEVKEVIDLIKPGLKHMEFQGKIYYFIENKIPLSKPPQALLLSLFDEYNIAYKYRGIIGGAEQLQKMFSSGTAVNSVIILDGRVAGIWKKKTGEKAVEITLEPFRVLGKSEEKALNEQAVRYGRFIGLTPIIDFQNSRAV